MLATTANGTTAKFGWSVYKTSLKSMDGKYLSRFALHLSNCEREPSADCRLADSRTRTGSNFIAGMLCSLPTLQFSNEPGTATGVVEELPTLEKLVRDFNSFPKSIAMKPM